ncbi:MAG: hypothetical protein JWR36_1159 [Glaciihabitans sp.]|nr:hypothetical protein [Glaciihabitans sp.]MDQ1569817.1 hypothetical protein [Actinomycetota bacterium]
MTFMLRSKLQVIVAGLSAIAIVGSLAGCANQSDTIAALASKGFAVRAKEICTQTGSTPLPLKGKFRVVAAADSTVRDTEPLVSDFARDSFNEDFQVDGSDNYVALCFAITPQGKVLLAQAPGARGSVIIGRW